MVNRYSPETREWKSKKWKLDPEGQVVFWPDHFKEVIRVRQEYSEKIKTLEAENKRLRDTMKTVSQCDACPVCAELADGHLYRLVTADQAGG